jgi:pyrimidine-nucleoside phosphorylase
MVVDGWRVPKIGVVGRPAGVIDSLGSVPGYRVSLTSDQFEGVLDRARFANVLADEDFAPDDRVLFAARQALGAQQVPSLAAASLLAKKLAAGLTRCVIDVRVGEGGNFGADMSAAEQNIELLKLAGGELQIEVKTALSSISSPLQPFVGRLESLMATVAVVDSDASGWLQEHAQSCVEIARLHGLGSEAADVNELGLALDLNLREQGVEGGLSTLRSWLSTRTRDAQHVQVPAPRAGMINWHMPTLRDTIVWHQYALGLKGFADPCGVRLLERSGTAVDADAPIAIVRVDGSGSVNKILESVQRASGLSDLHPSEG